MNRKFPFLFLLLICLVGAGLFTVAAQEEVRAQVKPFELNVREGPSARTTLLGAFKQGSFVLVKGREDLPNNGGIWVFATSGDGSLSGWVLSDYLKMDRGILPATLPVMPGFAASDQPTAGTGSAAAGSATAEPGAPPADGTVTGSTTTIVNLRSGPGLRYSVIKELTTNTFVTLTARSDDARWVQVVVDGQTGWIYTTLLRISGSVRSLPVAGKEGVPVTPVAVADVAAGAGGAPPSSASAMPGVVPTVSARAHQIYLAGQKLGNRPDVFSKVGDSITYSPYFLQTIGDGGLHLYNYAYLQPVVDYFMRTPARTHNSFSNTSLAAYYGWTSSDILNPSKNLYGVCGQEVTPLVCEYQNTKPALALIMVGTNDIQFGTHADVFRGNLELIVQTSIDMGVIPVLSTIPDNVNYEGLVGLFNDIIVSVAAKYNIPLWNYWLALQSLPNRGLDPDGTHPSIGSGETGVLSDEELKYGYNMRNLTALMVLDAVRRGAIY